MNQKVPKRAIMTICSNNYFPYARVLLSSVRQYHPEASLFLCLADIKNPEIPLEIDRVEIIEAQEFDISHFSDFAFRYTIMELNTAVKPFMMRYLIEKRGFEQVVYLDPDIELFAPITPVFDALEKGANFVLTPHLTKPAEEESLYPDDLGIMKVGVYNLGFFAVSNSSSVVDFLHWWGRRLRFQCLSQQEKGIFVDQKFVDLLLGFHDNVKVLRDPTLNVAYWNLGQRKLEETAEGWLVNGQPLVFFHFSGIDSNNSSRLSKYTSRFNGYLEPALQSLVEHYLSQWKKFRIKQAVSVDYAYGRFKNGIAITELIRYCYLIFEDLWVGDPFESFHKYLNEPYGYSLVSNLYPLTNLMYGLWKQTEDLQKAFNIDSPEGRKNYALWFTQASEELRIDYYFLAPVIDEINQLRSHNIQAHKTSSVTQWETDVSIIGYLRSVIGIGHAGRMVLQSIKTTNIRTNGFNVTFNVETRQGDCSVDSLLSPVVNGRVQIYNINADQLGLVKESIAPFVKPAEYIINMPFWELSKFPSDWLLYYEEIDEIWAPTRFVQLALQSVFNIPIIWMPPAVYVEDFVKLKREDFNLPSTTFLFHFNFDLSSFATRKNPMAVIDAYRLAFRNYCSEVSTALVIKTRGQDIDDQNIKKLYESVEGESDIFIFNKLMTYQETISLIDCCDCYVSLHRSEGFGYTLAEAMLLGKPVIATDYSGSKDFINSSTGFPVKYQMKSLNQDDYIYWEGQKWAEPDIEHAAWLMRRLVQDEFNTRLVALSGQNKILTDYSIEALGQRYLKRLQQIEVL